jgi:sigma-E factor negative regulatory protein RseA
MSRIAQGGSPSAGSKTTIEDGATGHSDAVSDAELLSALVDGELDAAAARALVARIGREPALRAQWERFHVVQDALRSHEVAALASFSCLGRVERALRAEPALLAPRRLAVPRAGMRWALPGLGIAAAAAAVLVGAPMLRAPANDYGVQAAGPRAVATPANLPVRPLAAAPARFRPDDLNDYLAAHRDLAGTGLIPRATPLLRATLADDR